MKGKKILDSLWFNAAMSILAVVGLVINIIDKSYIMTAVWVVIAYHFIKTTYNKRKTSK